MPGRKKTAEPPPPRGTYRHGDLRRALLDAGIALARAAGPDAVVLREATRRAGVVPNAAYRHFASREDLFQAVRAAALAELAVAMEREIARIPAGLPAVEAARARLRAVGQGYLKFARAEPGLFHTAFSGPEEVEGDTDPAKAGRSGMNPFQLLSSALDELSACGALPAARRPGAEYLAWSAVHGLALLVADGPLRNVTAAQRNAIAERLLDMVEKGI
ncbi:TetR/AcrR family transcriptional regulator [Candidimonas nitroreducens]|uniref:TetR family transcriptional regulator n=1 Tax=Candidimonas nitroreducens TaxID=683354 RepID=A0A225ME67_9BURK|nr:TetR/AcrR family transcriptional regulator [Candidimonas nitroreducens]OWT59082.1 TetR family transcriptional regulator [Candidimonas nitroreducens]